MRPGVVLLSATLLALGRAHAEHVEELRDVPPGGLIVVALGVEVEAECELGQDVRVSGAKCKTMKGGFALGRGALRRNAAETAVLSPSCRET